ncbi:MAG: hypothetical protein L6R38_002490 [Xanthoria sp. 2 TBL-2021]|nr:MAG: hypothetical protein L6R38_002490 [Xanthoria sp. 2 TBL-2021]
MVEAAVRLNWSKNTLAMIPLTFILLLFHLAVTNANQISQQPLTDIFPGNWEPELGTVSCTVSHTTAFETANGPVTFSTSGHDNLDVPRLSSINATSWEQWEFDSVSDTGLAGIMMGFSRDASYAFFGQGNLRVEFYIVLADDSVVQELDYVSESTIEVCPDLIRGVWQSQRNKRTYSFAVTRDMKHAKLTFDSGSVKGNFTITSSAPAHLPNGDIFPSKNPRSTELAPKLHMAQPTLGGRTTTDLVINKTPVRFTGTGGHVRIWAKDSWFAICQGWHRRAVAGPYVISYWQPVSRVSGHKGQSYPSAQLFHNGEKIMSPRRRGGKEGSGNLNKNKDDYVLFSDETGGEVKGGLAHDPNSGHVIEFVSPSLGKRWRFRVQHMRKQFEMGLGGASGLTGFTNRVSGGEVGEVQYEGRALSEQVLLPEVIAQWRIWIVFGIGMLNQAKNYLMGLIGAG